jgi:glycine/D-amino acid oxidase-like deaminating enzyme
VTPRLDVLIVGAGPIGLTLACHLRHLGLEVRLIEKRPGPSVHSKAIATAWTLTKRGHRVVCTIHEHPLGVEVRLDLDGELHRSDVIRCAVPVRELPAHVLTFVTDWREKWVAKGWILQPPTQP